MRPEIGNEKAPAVWEPWGFSRKAYSHVCADYSMSLNWIEGVLRNSRHTGTDLLLMILLAESADRDTGSCYPGRKTLARLMRSSERTVQRTVQTLVESGELFVRQQSSPFGTNLYTLDISLLGGDKNDSHYPRSLDRAQGETRMSPGGDKNVTQGETEMSPKPLVEPIKKKKPTVSKKNFAGFDEIWTIYPRKTAKMNAERAWGNLSDEDRIAALAGIRNLLPDYTAREKTHIPHLATFLNGRRWNDEPIVPRTTSNGHVPTRMAIFEDNQ